MTGSSSKARILKCLFSELPLFYILYRWAVGFELSEKYKVKETTTFQAKPSGC